MYKRHHPIKRALATLALVVTGAGLAGNATYNAYHADKIKNPNENALNFTVNATHNMGVAALEFLHIQKEPKTEEITLSHGESPASLAQEMDPNGQPGSFIQGMIEANPKEANEIANGDIPEGTELKVPIVKDSKPQS